MASRAGAVLLAQRYLLVAALCALATLPRQAGSLPDPGREPTLLISIPLAPEAFERRSILRAAFRATRCRGVTAVFLVDPPADGALATLLRVEQEVFEDVPFTAGGERSGAEGPGGPQRTSREFLRLAPRVKAPHPYPAEHAFFLPVPPNCFVHVPNLLSRLEGLPRRRAMARLGAAAGRELDPWERAGALHVLLHDLAGTPGGLSRREEEEAVSFPDDARGAFGDSLEYVAWNASGEIADFAAGAGDGGAAEAPRLLGAETLAVRGVETRKQWATVAAAFSLPSPSRLVSATLSRTARFRCTHMGRHESIQPAETTPFAEEEEGQQDAPVPLRLRAKRRVGGLHEALRIVSDRRAEQLTAVGGDLQGRRRKTATFSLPQPT